MKQKALYIPTSAHTDRVFRPQTFARMRELFDVTVNDTGESPTTEEVTERIGGHDALVTGWGSPSLNAEFFEQAEGLRIIAHSAGSVRFMIDRELIDKYLIPGDICVFSANVAIAYNVAESTVGMLIMAPRRWIEFATHFRQTGEWKPRHIESEGQFLLGAVVGLVGASAVGREVIKLLQPFDVTILLYDPCVSEDQAAELGVEKVELNELFRRSDMVSLHAPKIPETANMIDAEQLKLLRDGAALINTARGSIIDHDALLAECQSGRIVAALDVTEPEPPPPDSPFRKLENVIITPHIAARGHYGLFRIGESTVKALEDRFAGRPVEGAVDFDVFEQLA
ncbi:MAG: hydroxyacid dehydrogenase [Armatimonadota bacterium]